jgi:hypothetical protein
MYELTEGMAAMTMARLISMNRVSLLTPITVKIALAAIMHRIA